MICPKCGTNNIEGTAFCVKCGFSFNNVQQVSNTAGVSEQQVVYQQAMNNQNNYNQGVVNPNPGAGDATFDYFKYFISALKNPFKAFKSEESKLSDTKISLIFSSLIALLMIFVNLFKTVFDIVMVKKYDYSAFKYKTTFDFENLSNVDWLSVIGKNILIFVGFIVLIAAVYYIVSLIFKKSASFVSMLSIAATALIPFILFSMIVSPLIGKIWEPLSAISMVIGVVYALMILVNLIDDYLQFDDIDLKIYFHLICLSILLCAGYYLYMKIMIGSISSGIDGFLDIFG